MIDKKDPLPNHPDDYYLASVHYYIRLGEPETAGFAATILANRVLQLFSSLRDAAPPREPLRAGSDSPRLSSTRPIRHARAGRRTHAAECFGEWAARAAGRGDKRQAYTFAAQAAHFAALAILESPEAAGMDSKPGQSPHQSPIAHLGAVRP